MGIIAFEFAKSAWNWLSAHWREAGWFVAALFIWLWHGASGSLTTCKADLAAEKSKPPVVIEARAQGEARGSQKVSVVWPKSKDGKPTPCPDVTVDSNNQAASEASAQQKPLAAPTPVPVPYWGIEVGAGVPVYAPGDSRATLSVIGGPWRAGAGYSFQSGPSVEIAHRWMFVY